MANLANTYSWTADQADVKEYLGIVGTDEDMVLELLYSSAIELGDQYLGNPFTTDEGTDVVHPVSIRLGLYEFVKNMREHKAYKPGINAVREGDVSLNFGFNLVRDYFQTPLPPPVCRFWFSYKKGLMR